MSSTKCGAVVYVTSLSQHTLVQHTHHTQISSFYNLTMYNFKQVLTPGVLLGCNCWLHTYWLRLVDTFYGLCSGLTEWAEVLCEWVYVWGCFTLPCMCDSVYYHSIYLQDHELTRWVHEACISAEFGLQPSTCILGRVASASF